MLKADVFNEKSGESFTNVRSYIQRFYFLLFNIVNASKRGHCDKRKFYI